ncbi:hypothetical protein LSM04_001096 [Trypanosoma melophagium]|uniref:uncharacterized protein n=1 Tax=Trypanosoma melophagium TaxID=715481 RepID=UPI00351A0181|nr:hypothetical protein LSM04_001096 [Trypanosoma melophagium]
MSGKSTPQLGASASQTPPFNSNSDDIVGARMGSSGRPRIDNTQSAAIERFLLDGNLGDLLAGSTVGPRFGVSVASTLAPGSETIHGPGTLTENPSFVSTRFLDFAETQGSEASAPAFASSIPSAAASAPSVPSVPSAVPAATTPAVISPAPSAKQPPAVDVDDDGPLGRRMTLPPSDTTMQKSVREDPLSKNTRKSISPVGKVEVPPSIYTPFASSNRVPSRDNSNKMNNSNPANALELEMMRELSRLTTPPRGLHIQPQQRRGYSIKKGGDLRRCVSTTDIRGLQTSPRSGYIDPETFGGRYGSPSMRTASGYIDPEAFGGRYGSPSMRTASPPSSQSNLSNPMTRKKSGGSSAASTKVERGGKGVTPTWNTATDRIKRDVEKKGDSTDYEGILPPDTGRMGWKSRQSTYLRASDVNALKTGSPVGHVGGGYPSSIAHSSLMGSTGTAHQSSGDRFHSPYMGSHGPGSVAMSEQFVGRNMRVRAKHGVRSTSGTVNSGGVNARSGIPAVSNGEGSQRKNGSSVPGSTTTKSPKGFHHAEDIFMSLVGGKRKEKQRPPPLFATDAALPALISTEVAAPRGSLANGNTNGNGGGGNGKGGGGNGGNGNGDGGNKKLLDVGDEEEREEQHFRDYKRIALHAIPWDQRAFIPLTGFGTKTFGIFSAPLFWEKLDWTVRASLFTVLPTMILTLEPATAGIFPLPSSVAFLAFWITMPTFGSGLREFIITLKGYALSLVMLMVVIAINPKESWLILLLLFLFVLLTSFFAEQVKKTCAYCLAVFLMQRQADPNNTGMTFVGDYFITLLIALAFGLAAFFIPNIRWSSELAKLNVTLLGNSLSIYVQGVCASFWTRSPLERELHLVRLRQLKATSQKAISKANMFFEEAEYEPHSGAFMSSISVRHAFLVNISDILSSMVQVIDLINDNPQRVETPLCINFGNAIAEDLAVISAAMDSMILKISDFKHPVESEDIQMFKESRERFQERVSEVRQEVILNNEMYETDESDVLLGFFMFSVDELCEVIVNFNPEGGPRSTILEWLKTPLNDCKSSYDAFTSLITTIIHNHDITRRAKEAIKLALCMTVPSIFQIYALRNDETSPVAGAAIIAFVYSQTGAQSFTYAVNRVLGTVLGSLTALLAVKIADGSRWVLYIAVAILSFVGAYIQTSAEYLAAGNAVCNSVISIITQYTNPAAAMVRIEQNVFAILIYFCISMTIWPMRANKKVRMSFDISLRCFREVTSLLLRNLDMPEDVSEVNSSSIDILKEWNKKIKRQSAFLRGAITEPTLVGADFPEIPWRKLIAAQWNLWSVLSMMRFAYYTFMSSKVDDATELSVHWVVLRRISPYAKDLCDLLYATIDLYLLSLGKTTVVPISHLTRLRHGMLEAEQRIVEVYIQTICRKLGGESSEEEDGDGDEGFGFASRGNLNENSLSRGSLQQMGVTNGEFQPTIFTQNAPQVEENHDDEKDDADSMKAKKQEKKRKDGYLMYNLTPEELEELKKHLVNRSFAATMRDTAAAGTERGSNDGSVEINNKKGKKGLIPESFTLNASFRNFMNRRSSQTARTNEVDEAIAKIKGNKKRGKQRSDLGDTVQDENRNVSFSLKPASLSKRQGGNDDLPYGHDVDDEQDSFAEKKVAEEGEERCKYNGNNNGEHAEEEEGEDRRKHNQDGLQERIATGTKTGTSSYPETVNTLVVRRNSATGERREKEKTRSRGHSFSTMEGSTAHDGDRSSVTPTGDASEILNQLSFFDAERKEFVLTNQDIHSLEAFLFGVRALTVQLGELQKALLELQNAEELARKV